MHISTHTHTAGDQALGESGALPVIDPATGKSLPLEKLCAASQASGFETPPHTYQGIACAAAGGVQRADIAAAASAAEAGAAAAAEAAAATAAVAEAASYDDIAAAAAAREGEQVSECPS
eukprot:1157876-Pelagomonas_calceolata.AAC.5